MRYLPRFFRLLLLTGFSSLLAAPSLSAQVLTGAYDLLDIIGSQTARSLTASSLYLRPDSSLTVGTGTSNTSQVGDIEMWSGASLILNTRSFLEVDGTFLVLGDNIRITLMTPTFGVTTLDGSVSSVGAFYFSAAGAVVTVNSRTLFQTTNLYLGDRGANNQMIVTGVNAQVRATNDFVVGAAFTDPSSGQHYQGGGILTVQSGGKAVADVGISLGLNSGSSGTLNIGAYDLTNPTTAGTVTSPYISFVGGNGAINFNQTDATNFSTSLIGTGSVTQRGTGTTTLSADNGSFSGTTTVQGGTLIAGSATAFGVTTVTVQGGTLDLGGYAVANALDLRGGSVLGLSHYTGTQTVNTAASYSGNVGGSVVITSGGSVNTTAATFTGNVTVQNGAALSGTGTINFATFANGAHLAPGNSPGTITFTQGLTLNQGAILDFQLGSISDLILVTGGTLTGPGTVGGITLNLSNAGGFTAGTYTLINYATASGTSQFAADSFALGSTIAGYTYNLALNSGQLQLTATAAVPEPSTYAALAGLAALGLAAWRRRSSKAGLRHL